MDDPQKSTPPIVLSYNRNVPGIVRGVTYERQDGMLTITVGPPPFGRLIVFRVIAFVAFGVFSVMFFGAIVTVPSYAMPPGAVTVSIALLLIWGTVTMLRRLVLAARHGKKPSVVRVWPGGLEISTWNRHREVHVELPRDRICDLQVHPFVGGLSPKLNLQIVSNDDSMTVVDIPWRSGFPMIEVEDNLRDVLGLPPTK